MPYKFSPSTECFYPDDIAYPAGAIPDDAIEASEDQFAAAMARAPHDTLAVVDGAVTVVAYAGPTLDEAKAQRIAMLNSAYRGAITAPVAFTTAGDASAMFAQSDQAKANLAACIAAGAEAWTLNLWLDARGQPVAPFAYADLQALSAAMAAADVPPYLTLLAKIGAVTAATSIEAVEAVTI